jgi:hypothetical protein
MKHAEAGDEVERLILERKSPIRARADVGDRFAQNAVPCKHFGRLEDSDSVEAACYRLKLVPIGTPQAKRVGETSLGHVPEAM